MSRLLSGTGRIRGYSHYSLDEVITAIWITRKQLVYVKQQLHWSQRMRSSTSPFRSSIYGATGEQPLQIRLRALENDKRALTQELSALRGTAKRSQEVDEKVELILKQNSNLLNENQQLSKLISQRKAEVEIWRSKFESMAASTSTANELEVQKLVSEINKLKGDLVELQHLKNIQLNKTESQLSQEISHIKRVSTNALEQEKLENKKLKEICEAKDYEASELSIRLNRLGKDTELEFFKLKEDKERLRKELELQQEEHRREVGALKSKLEMSLHLELEKVKKLHQNEAQALAFENNKLKDLVSIKSTQIQQGINKNIKVKHNYEQQMLLLKRENESLKDKISENERMFQLEIANLREKLENMRESEMSLLKSAHTNQVQILSNEVGALEDIIDSKNVEIETLVRDKNQAKIYLEAELAKLRAYLEDSQVVNKENQRQHELDVLTLQSEIKARDQENALLRESFAKRTETLKEELKMVKELLEGKTRELEREKDQIQADRRSLSNNIKDLERQVEEHAQDHDRTKTKATVDSDDTKRMHDSKVQQLAEKIRSLEELNSQRDGIISTLKNTIQTKQGQMDTSDKNTTSLERTNARLKKELEQSKLRNINKEAEYNKITKDQRERMNSNFDFELNSVKNQLNNQISGWKLQIADLKKQLETKTLKLDELKKMYDHLLKETEKVLNQQAHRKALDIKEPGWLPQTISTKGLFDVFLKNKVIQFCDV